MPITESLFRIYSIGVAATNKKRSEKTIEVYPIEILPFIDGDITDNVNEDVVKGSDALNKEYQVRLAETVTVSATWLQRGSNRLTAPDIRRGERVLLWRYGDNDKFYWTSMGMDDDLRKLETVILAVSDTTDESDTELTTENTYSLEVSTHDGHVTLSTAKSNGEPFKYTLQFNTKDGVVTLTDDAQNFIELDSGEKSILAENGDGSFIKIDKKNIQIHAEDNITADAKNINVEASEYIELKVGGTMFRLEPSQTTLKTPNFKGMK